MLSVKWGFGYKKGLIGGQFVLGDWVPVFNCNQFNVITRVVPKITHHSNINLRQQRVQGIDN